MEKDGGERKMSQAQRDFIALSHGQEWTSFYESFDKLVQDNLSRSSELLRRAMSLPELADREVQQIRTEMEAKIAAERSAQRDLLSSLRDEVGGSHRQVSMLATSIGAVMGDLDRLGQRVNDALASLEALSVASEPAKTPTAPAETVPSLNGLNGNYATAPSVPVFAPEDEPVAVAEAPVVEEGSLLDELPEVAEFQLPVDDFNMDDIAAAVEEQEAMLQAAEQQLDSIESSIDLDSLAEAEAAAAPVADAGDAGLDAAGEQRPRPHWLSVTRVGSR